MYCEGDLVQWMEYKYFPNQPRIPDGMNWGRYEGFYGGSEMIAEVRPIKRQPLTKIVLVEELSRIYPQYLSAYCGVCLGPFEPGRNGECEVSFSFCGHVCHRFCFDGLQRCRSCPSWSYFGRHNGQMVFDSTGKIPVCFFCNEKLHPDMEIRCDIHGIYCPFCRYQRVGGSKRLYIEFGNTYNNDDDE